MEGPSMISKSRIVFFLSFVLLSIPAFSMSLKIDKMRIEAIAEPGKVIQGIINVINDQKEPLQIFTGLDDFDFNSEKQQVIFKPMGSQTDSCSKWVQVLPKQTLIPAETNFAIQYVITVPREGLTLGEYYSSIYVETAPTKTDMTAGLMLNSRARMAITIKVRIEGIAQPQGKIEALTVIPPKGPDKPVEITYDFTNTGNTMQKVTGQFSIIDSQGNLFGRGTLDHGVCKGQGTKIHVKSQWEGELKPGAYDLISELKYDPDITDIKESHFEIK